MGVSFVGYFLLSLLFLVSLISLSGIPPFVGFFGKVMGFFCFSSCYFGFFFLTMFVLGSLIRLYFYLGLFFSCFFSLFRGCFSMDLPVFFVFFRLLLRSL